MTRTCWRPLAALLTFAVAGSAVQGQELLPMPGCCAKAASCGSNSTSEGRLVQKTYPISVLICAFDYCNGSPDLVMKFLSQSVAPESWSVHGGRGMMEYFPLGMALVVTQTPKIQKQIGALLGAMNQVAEACAWPIALVPVGLPIPPPPMPPPPVACPYSPEKSAHSPEPKQHFRFVLDNLRIRTDDKTSVTIKHVEVEYAGDGIDADVAKCAITLGGSEKKVEKDVGTAAAGAALGAVSGGLTGNAIEPAKPAEEKAESKEAARSEEKSDKAEPKKVEEEEDHED